MVGQPGPIRYSYPDPGLLLRTVAGSFIALALAVVVKAVEEKDRSLALMLATFPIGCAGPWIYLEMRAHFGCVLLESDRVRVRNWFGLETVYRDSDIIEVEYHSNGDFLARYLFARPIVGKDLCGREELSRELRSRLAREEARRRPKRRPEPRDLPEQDV